MVIDTSALLAIIFGEPELTHLIAAVYKDQNRYVSAVSFLESSIVLQARFGKTALRQLGALLRTLAVDVVSFDDNQARLARAAWLRFGKGRHVARLNFGDCCTYALAKRLREPLLFKGGDFDKTDVKAALNQ
jgi:ribonuclease VapC